MVNSLKSKRLRGIKEYYFSQKLNEIDLLKKAGKNILNLGIGSPDMLPPQAVNDALVEAMNDPQCHRYQSNRGMMELRDAFSQWYKRFYCTFLDPEREILPLMGSKEGIIHICMAFLNKGDEVLIPNPSYPTYTSAVKLANGIPKEYSLKSENNYEPDFEELVSSDLRKVKMMWVNYPHMPTGKEASKEVFKKLRAFCRRNEIILNDLAAVLHMHNRPIRDFIAFNFLAFFIANGNLT